MGYLCGNMFILKSYRREFYRKILAFWKLEKGKFGDCFSKKKISEAYVSQFPVRVSCSPHYRCELESCRCQRFFPVLLSQGTPARLVCWLWGGFCPCAILEEATRWESGTNAGKPKSPRKKIGALYEKIAASPHPLPTLRGHKFLSLMKPLDSVPESAGKKNYFPWNPVDKG